MSGSLIQASEAILITISGQMWENNSKAKGKTTEIFIDKYINGASSQSIS